jgi:RNA polymerase sigma-70 factor (ECF subfamily)
MPDNQSDNKKKVALLFEEHADYLYGFALSRVNDAHIAEDLVQDTFVSALKSFDSFKQKSKASTWLTAILKNKIIDHYRKKVREYHKESMEGVAASDDFFDQKGHWRKEERPKNWNIDTDRGLEQEEFYRILKNCLKKLNELHRIAFVMKHLDDVDTSDICKELEITASNYWVIMHRAKLQLRKCMETQWINA